MDYRLRGAVQVCIVQGLTLYSVPDTTKPANNGGSLWVRWLESN